MQAAGVAVGAHSGSRRDRDRDREPSRQGPWRCGNCPKEFAQKEYRDKHQRRCIQASSRQRLSKQKSCVACAASKLGCDLGTPSCSRCLNRGKRCQYVSSSSIDVSAQRNQQQWQQRGQPDVQTQENHEQLLYRGDEAHSSLGKNVGSGNIPPTDTSPELDTNMRVPTGSDHGEVSSLMALSTPPPQHPHRLPVPSSHLALGGWPMESPPHARRDISDQLADGPLRDAGISPDWLRQNIYPFGTAGSDSGESTSRWQRNGLWPSGSPFMSSDGSISAEMEDVNGNSVTGISKDDFNFDLLGSLGVLTRNHITSAPNVQQSPLSAMLRPQTSTNSPGMSMAPPVGNIAIQDQSPLSNMEGDGGMRATLHDAVKMAYGGSSSLSGLVLGGKFEENGRQRCPFHKLNTDDDLVRIICDYPRIMVRPGEYPPFVHHKLYRCAAGDISEPLARAFCCVGAFYASVPTSETFVYSLINEESSKLVKIFHQWSGSDSDMLAVVHAMCIYQILGFFVSSSPAQARLSELLHLFFLKMTRRLIQQYLQSITDEDNEVNWRKWIMKETIRRTVFLVNTINTLSCRIQKQNPYYFEPLDDNLVRNMTLPAPESVWKASSSEEWMAAKAQLGSEDTARSRLTIQQVVEQFMADGDTSDHRSSDDCRVQYEQFDEFTKLIIATASNG